MSNARSAKWLQVLAKHHYAESAKALVTIHQCRPNSDFLACSFQHYDGAQLTHGIELIFLLKWMDEEAILQQRVLFLAL